MIKRNIFYCLLLGNSLFAQKNPKITIDAGYTYSSLNVNTSNLIESKYNNRYGIGINFSTELIIWKNLFISPGISYLQKNYEFIRTGSKSGWYTKYDNNFLSMPLLIGGYIINNPNKEKSVWLKIAGGMYSEYLLSLNREGRYPIFSELNINNEFNYREFSEKYNFKENENELKRFGYGLQGQSQLGYSFENLGILVSYNYQYGLSDIMKYNINHREKAKRISYMISLGISYNFK